MSHEVTVVRIYLKEADHGRRKTLVQEIINVLHDQHRIKGATVFRGIAGFDDNGEVHASDILRILVDLPVVIEFFDEPRVVEAVMNLLNDLIGKHPVISWRATLW